MKASFWDRVLMFLYVLLSCVLLLGVALRPFGVDIIGDLVLGLEAAAGSFWSLVICYGIVLIVAGVILIILCVPLWAWLSLIGAALMIVGLLLLRK